MGRPLEAEGRFDRGPRRSAGRGRSRHPGAVPPRRRAPSHCGTRRPASRRRRTSSVSRPEMMTTDRFEGSVHGESPCLVEPAGPVWRRNLIGSLRQVRRPLQSSDERGPLWPIVNVIGASGSDGFARRCSAPTTASCQPRVLSSAWLRRRRPAKTSWSPAWRVLWRARCPWRQANTCRSAPRRTPSRRISSESSTSLPTEPQAEEDELTGIYVRRGLEPELARTVAQQLTAKGRVGCPCA